MTERSKRFSHRHEDSEADGISRRTFLGGLIGSSLLVGAVPKRSKIAGASANESSSTVLPGAFRSSQTDGFRINRAALARRHNPVLRKLEPDAPLSIGNGEFAFTADITGLQTFPLEYRDTMPLCTMSQWGWHTTPLPPGLDPQSFRLTSFDTHGRKVAYATSSDGQKELYDWLRENPHRLHLGQIGLRLFPTNQKEAQVTDVSDIEQTLDLWTGILTSRYRFQSIPVGVRTAVHPDLDLLAVSLESKLIESAQLAVLFSFPYGSPSLQAADWDRADRHETTIVHQNSDNVVLRRALDADGYFVSIGIESRASFVRNGAHSFLLTAAKEKPGMEFVVAFSSRLPVSALPTVAGTFGKSTEHWNNFWSDGAAVELAESKDWRAPELERRIVLSQYLTAIQCAGSTPPQETGLTVNSWYGKFHLEMHWWHAAHFVLWNRRLLLEKSLGWYSSILPSARERARQQGYQGARWPKMTAIDGRDSPSPIGPLLIWQQPHPIFLAELCYSARPERATLERYRQIVSESAQFMGSYAFSEEARKRYVLGPPVIPAQENHPPRETWNPTFELAYWSYGLELAQRWRKRTGLQREPQWDQVIAGLSALPMRDGVYLAHENCPQTFSERNSDHPSMLAALGMLPGRKVDPETMRRTLHRVMKEWQWDQTWGWDYPLTAMTAARLGEPALAVDALMMKTEKNRYLPNGHNWQRKNLPCYLPANGGLLYVVAMMAGGWQSVPRTDAPGFPADGSWTVRAEKFNPSVVA